MEKTADTLNILFRLLHDTHTRGDGAPDLTQREEWIISKLGFLKTISRHRAEPLLQSVSTSALL